MIAMSLQNEKVRKIGSVLVPATVALLLLSLAVAAGIYDSLLEPLSGRPPIPCLVEASLALPFFGVGCSMFSLAGALRNGEIQAEKESLYEEW